MDKYTKRKNGISLITLIVTVLVITVISAIAIKMTIQTGALDMAEQGKNDYTVESLKEIVNYTLQERIMEKSINGNNNLTLKEELEKIKEIDSVEKLDTGAYYISNGSSTITLYENGTIKEGKVSIWDGTSEEVPEIKNSDWYIYNTAQFKFFADFVNNGNQLTNTQAAKLTKDNYEGIDNIKLTATTTVYLMSNLDFAGNNFSPIGNGTNKFEAIFDGNGHYIERINIKSSDRYVGLFGYSTNEIKELTIKHSHIEGDTAMIGGIVGLGKKVTNCNNDNTTVVQGNDGLVGGIAGRVDVKIFDCTNTGNITGKVQGGGIVGGLNTSAEVNNCINKGLVKVGTIVGGIIGCTRGTSIINNCINKGNVIGSGNNIGGIVGTLVTSTINNSSNYGSITGDKDKTGGITGSLGSSSTVYKCKNFGNISALNGVMTGGIAGINEGTVESCVNSGIVTGKSLIGGITGYLKGTVDRCGNTGTIKQPENIIENETGSIGGLVGQIAVSSTVSIQYSYNRGQIIINIDGAEGIAGIVGWISRGGGTTGNVTNTYNTGLIQVNAENVIGIGGTTGQIESTAVATGNNYCVEGITKVEPHKGWAQSGTIMSLEAMKKSDFITILNSNLEEAVWEIRSGENEGYPVPKLKPITNN